MLSFYMEGDSLHGFDNKKTRTQKNESANLPQTVLCSFLWPQFGRLPHPPHELHL